MHNTSLNCSCDNLPLVLKTSRHLTDVVELEVQKFLGISEYSLEVTVLVVFCVQLDSATSLIQAAKNLMNAVVLAVKASYVASTKYTRAGAGVSICTVVLISAVCFYTLQHNMWLV